MKKVTLICALAIFGAFAANAKTNETKSEKAEVVVTSTTESAAETQDFYVDNSGNRLSDAYPTLGACEETSDPEQNCHATYTRQDSSSPWIQQGAIVKGLKPF